MVALETLSGPIYHPTKPLSSKYTVKPLAERVQDMQDYLLRLRIQREIECGCNGITAMSCPACDEAMECQCDSHPDREVMACLVCRVSAQMKAEKEEPLPF